jgi:hypothetical protein
MCLELTISDCESIIAEAFYLKPANVPAKHQKWDIRLLWT